jgi:hypothetical protein
MYVWYLEFFRGGYLWTPPTLVGGEVLGHMSNGYNSLTFLCFFHTFYGFQPCSKKIVNTNVYTKK